MAIYSAKNARRALVDTVVFRAISQGAAILGFIVLVRAMPEEDFGVFNLLYAFIPVISTVASLGLEQTLRRYQPEYLSAGNTAAARWLVRFVASARFGTNVILLALILATWTTVAPIFKLGPYRGEFAFLCLLVLLHFQARIMQLSLAANMLHRFSVGSVAVVSVVKLTGYSVFAWLGALTLPIAILTDTVAFALAYLMLLAAYRKHCPSPPGEKFRPERVEQKRLLRYGLFNNFNDAGSMFLGTKSDNFFIAAFMDPTAVAVYAFYNRLEEMFGRFRPGRLFSNVIQPLFFSVPANQADDRIPRYFSLLFNLSLLTQVPVLAFAFSYHVEIVDVIFGGRYLNYAVLLPIIMAFSTLNSFSTPATMVAQYEERAGIILLSKGFALYNVAALLLMIPMAGIHGAVVATGSANLMKNLFIWWFARRRARWMNGFRSVISIILVWGPAILLCLVLKDNIQQAPMTNLSIGLVICGVGLLIYCRTPAFSPSDRTILASVLKGPERRLFVLIGLLNKR